MQHSPAELEHRLVDEVEHFLAGGFSVGGVSTFGAIVSSGEASQAVAAVQAERKVGVRKHLWRKGVLVVAGHTLNTMSGVGRRPVGGELGIWSALAGDSRRLKPAAPWGPQGA